MGDASKRPLRIPPWHLPYLEKHRIYELFHEIARELVIQQPKDHVMFMKQILNNAAKSRDVSRVVIICSPRINSLKIAQLMSRETGQIVITEKDVLSAVGKKQRSELTVPLLLRALFCLVRTNNAYKLGWIIADCIRSEDEAKAMLKAGILPTHVLHIIPPYYPNINELLYCNVSSDFPEYRRAMHGLRDAFKKVLKEVFVQERSNEEVAKECIEIAKIKPGIAPITPRVVLLGPRGSGRRSQAHMLVQSLDLVYINFEYLLCQVWISRSDLAAKMRECNDEVCLHSELMIQVLNKRLLEDDCLRKGYVLTHYPFTVQDFKLLDSVDTPPNRVIFLDVDLNVCRERIKNRRQNVYSGSVIHLTKDKVVDEKEYVSHPKDYAEVADAENSYYCEQYGSIRKYCGGTANTVNGDQTKLQVHECITSIIVRMAPPFPPRKGLKDYVPPPLPAHIEESDGSEASSSVRCCCEPMPQNLVDCYTNIFKQSKKEHKQ